MAESKHLIRSKSDISAQVTPPTCAIDSQEYVLLLNLLSSSVYVRTTVYIYIYMWSVNKVVFDYWCFMSGQRCRRISGPTRRSTKGGWTPEQVGQLFHVEVFVWLVKIFISIILFVFFLWRTNSWWMVCGGTKERIGKRLVIDILILVLSSQKLLYTYPIYICLFLSCLLVN